MKTAAALWHRPRPGPLWAVLVAGFFVLTGLTAAEHAGQASGALAPLPLTLPAPTIKGTPPDNPPTGPHIEPLNLDQVRAPFLAPAGVKNVALNKKATASDAKPQSGEPVLVTDGSKEANDDDVLELHKGRQHVQIDLEAHFRIYAIVIWLDHRYYQIIRHVVVQVADDAGFTKNVRTLFNNDRENSNGLGTGTDKEYFETKEGRLIDAKGAPARYVRCTTQGGSESGLNCYTEIEVYALPVQ